MWVPCLGGGAVSEYHAYIDESGDEGIGGKGSRWFMLAAVVTEAQKGPALADGLRRIRARIKLKTRVMHWTNLSHPRKLAVCEEIAKEDVMICAVLVDTLHPKMVQTTLVSGRLYFYAFRWLVERISWYCDERGSQVRLFPERKGGIDYNQFQAYLTYAQSLPDCQIRPNTIASIKPRDKSQLALLQLADAVAGALYAGFEDQYGVIEPAYVLQLKDKLYRRNGKVFGYGLKFMPHESATVPVGLLGSYAWLTQV